MLRFTPAEAAVLAGATLRTVHRSIDTLVPEAAGAKRRVSAVDIVLIAADAELSSRKLPLATRRRFIEKLRRNPRARLVYEGEILAVDVRRIRAMIARAIPLVRDLRRLAVSDPGIMGGEPVFRGTRIPVATIADMMAAGEPMAAILEAYPSLTARQVELAPQWAWTYPARGRPAARPWRARPPVRTARLPLRAR